jgi:methyltransferase
MVTTQAAYLGLLGFVALERGVELWLSRRNAALAFARGGIEVGREHLGFMRLLHTAFLLACALEVVGLDRRFDARVGVPMLVIAGAAQGLRYWSIATLGSRWNVRVIVVPGVPVVTSGPYRWLRHPNYAAVIAEGVAIPLIHGAWLTALGFTLANAWLLRTRIRVEERALAEHCELEARLGGRPRLVPIGGG